MTYNHISIGLFGFGCVGQGLYDVLYHSQSIQASIAGICVKDRSKPRTLDHSRFTFNKEDILSRDDLDVMVELIDNAEDALDIVSSALRKKINVVTANKKLLAENFEELYQLQETSGASLIYEGACGGSIPIIRTLEEYYDNELLCSISGIINGSCNYILTKMELENLSYANALRQAQELGFAETNPWLDVSGVDTKYKLCLLSIHAFGIMLKPEEILNLGIQNISQFDIHYARSNGLRIKLLARAFKVGDKFRIYALPHFLPKEHKLHDVNYEYNGIEVEGAFSDKQFFVGKGAGSHPTGSAVLSDVSALTYNYRYGYKKLKKMQGAGDTDFSGKMDADFTLRLYIRYEDRAIITTLDIRSIEEEYTSATAKYIIAHVGFSSLFSVMQQQDHGLFICCLE